MTSDAEKLVELLDILSGQLEEVKNTLVDAQELFVQAKKAADEFRFIETQTEEQEEEFDKIKRRYDTALRILEVDAKVSERDLDLVSNHADPVAALLRLRGVR